MAMGMAMAMAMGMAMAMAMGMAMARAHSTKHTAHCTLRTAHSRTYKHGRAGRAGEQGGRTHTHKHTHLPRGIACKTSVSGHLLLLARMNGQIPRTACQPPTHFLISLAHLPPRAATQRTTPIPVPPHQLSAAPPLPTHISSNHKRGGACIQSETLRPSSLSRDLDGLDR
eukprot:101796-Pleurochrysis_carterae.AAC.1